jgi:hypothetical protein
LTRPEVAVLRSQTHPNGARRSAESGGVGVDHERRTIDNHGGLIAIRPGGIMKDLDRLAKDDFDPFVGDGFELELGDDRTLPLELVSSDALSSATVERATRAPFSLTFRSPGELRHAPQRIYTVRHARLGPLAIFLVPIGPDEAGMRYEAVFT